MSPAVQFSRTISAYSGANSELSVMYRLRLVAIAVSIGLATGNAHAQGAPGYRMRAPTLGGQPGAGASVRPPRLTGPAPSILDRPGRQFGRRFVVPYLYFPWYPYVSNDYAYQEDSTADYSMQSETEAASDVYPADDSVPDVGRLHVSFESIVSRTVVRLTWPDQGVHAAQVAFFLADRARAVLSAQTVRSPPFTALFEPPPGTAFAGMTVVLPGGTLVTQFLPYRRRAR
jgi:hypothetical protein